MALKKLPGGVIVETDGGARLNEEAGVNLEAIHRQLAGQSAATVDALKLKADVTALNAVRSEAQAAQSTATNARDTSATAISTAGAAQATASNALALATNLGAAAGFGPSTPADATVAAYVEQASSLTTAALDRRYRRGYSVKEFGAAGNGTTDDTAAIQAAADAAFRDGATLHFPAGNYRTTSTVRVRCGLDGEAGKLLYYGTGTALVIGSDVKGTVTFREMFTLPHVRYMNRPTGSTAWDAGTLGVRAVNLNGCTVTVPFVQDFEQGLVLDGNGGGMAYNTVHLGSLWENRQNLVFTCTTDGYVNQNLVIGGRLQLSKTRNQVTRDPGAVQVKMVAENPEGGPNNNTFIGTSLESGGVPEFFLDMAGSYNYFINCRWESPGTVPYVRYRASAERNTIDSGYGVHRIVEQFDGNRVAGELRDTQGAYTRATLASSQAIPSGSSVPITAWGNQVGRRITQDTSTGRWRPRPGRWMIRASVQFIPATGGRRLAMLRTQPVGGGISTRTSGEVSPGTSTEAVRATINVQTIYRFDGQTDVWVEAQQTSGNDLGLEPGVGICTFEAEYLGP